MAEYELSAIVGVTAYTIVEADSLDEAIEIAEHRSAVIGGTGTGSDDREQWIIDDADGEPTDIHEA